MISNTSDERRFTKLTYEVSGGVAMITFDRPDHLNAIDHGPGSMEDELVEALLLSDADDDVRCNVITGRGRAFSAGGDIGARTPKETAVEWYDFHDALDRACEQVRSSRTPVIGAINGICYGYAFTLMTHFDIVIAAESARFGLLETRFGSTGVETLPYLVGAQWAKFLAFSGELISARRAAEIGLVLAAVPDDRFDEKVRDLARRVAAMPSDATVMNRRLIDAAVTSMGWASQKDMGRAMNAITNSVGFRARGVDGRVFSDVLRDEGWDEFKALRDGPFEDPWLED